MDEKSLEDRLVRLERSLEILRDCVAMCEPLVVEYYSKKRELLEDVGFA